MGASGRRMLAALVNGERSPKALAALGDYRLRATPAQLEAALTGRFRDIHAGVPLKVWRLPHSGFV